MEQLTLINPFIHQEAKLKKDKFLDRIKNVKQIRVCNIERYFLPNEIKDWNIIEELHSAINKGIFSFNSLGDKVFAFEISKNYYDWFLNNELQTIQKQIVNWIASVYLSRPNIQEYLEEYVYTPILNEAKKVIEKHYSTKFSEKYKPVFDDIEKVKLVFNEIYDETKYHKYLSDRRNSETEINKLLEEFETEYYNASISFINCPPPIFLKNPFTNSDIICFDNFSIKNIPNFGFQIAYFTEEDWLFIIERSREKLKQHFKTNLDKGVWLDSDIDRMLEQSETDNLVRAESDKIIWNKWLMSYENYDKTKSNIYKLFDEECVVGYVYIIRQSNSNFYKIGWTENKTGLTDKQSVNMRIASLQTGNPKTLEVIGFFRASSGKTEKIVHKLFDSKRLTGEWFSLNRNDLDNLLNSDWRISNNIF